MILTCKTVPQKGIHNLFLLPRQQHCMRVYRQHSYVLTCCLGDGFYIDIGIIYFKL